MSVLAFPRVFLAGTMAWDPIVGNNDPDGVCKEGAANVVPGSVVHTITYGAVTEGPIESDPVEDGALAVDDEVAEGAVTDGAITYGAKRSRGGRSDSMHGLPLLVCCSPRHRSL